MKNIWVKKIKIFSILLVAILVFNCFGVPVANAKTYKYTYTIYGTTKRKYYSQAGAEYNMLGANPRLTKGMSVWELSAVQPLLYAKFYSPKQVRKLYKLKSSISSSKKYKEAIELGISTAASVGIDKAKAAIKKKFGATVLGKVTPYLSLLSWSKTLYDIMKTIKEAQLLKLLEKAIGKGVGLVYYQFLNGISGWCYWDGSSKNVSSFNLRFGKYPYACIPDEWTYGTLKVKIVNK